MWMRLYRDEDGFVASTEAVLIGTILIIGIIAGLTAVRDAVASELGDASHALMNLNHTFSYAPVITDCGTVAGAVFLDNPDFCAPGLSDDDPPVYVGPLYFDPPGGAQPE